MNFRFRRYHLKSFLIAFLLLIVVICLNKNQFLPIDITDTILIKSHLDVPNAKSESKINIDKNGDYDNLILSIPENVIEKAPRIPYISGIKNPCFASFERRLLENVTIGEAITKGYTINCLPYFFLAGFTKCGTTDFHSRLLMHEHILSGNLKSRPIKELHWFDNFHFDPNHKFSIYLKLYQNATRSVMEAIEDQAINNQLDLDMQPILGDFTPRTVWHGDRWQIEEMNEGLSEPQVLVPHKIRKILPDAKIIMLMRNPTSRLLSDYNFQKFDHGETSPEDFHAKVSTAVKWWRDCKSLGLSDKRCAHGYYYPASLQPPLDFTKCALGLETDCHEFDPGNTWNVNPAPRLRIGLYYIFIREWLDQFPRDNMLFLRFEDYVQSPLETFEKQIFPFLGIKKGFTPEARDYLVQKEIKTGSAKKKPKWYVSMLPETKDLLDTFYGEYNSKLADILEDDSFRWD